jgi:DNA-binding ferritin-like protein
MGIATEMKKLSEDIIASYDMRIKAVGGLVKDTHQMLKGFHTEHKEMSAALRAELAKGEQSRLKDFKAMMSDIEKSLADATKNVASMIKGFQKDHKAMADELEAGLEQGETERLKDFQKMMSDIQKDIKEIETFVARKLKEFDAAHADMSEDLKKDLAKYVEGIVKETKKLLNECGSDMAQAKKAWSGMSATMAKARKAGFMMPKIDAGEKVTTVKQATRKAQGKKTSPKSEGSKQKVSAGV